MIEFNQSSDYTCSYTYEYPLFNLRQQHDVWLCWPMRSGYLYPFLSDQLPRKFLTTAKHKWRPHQLCDCSKLGRHQSWCFAIKLDRTELQISHTIAIVALESLGKRMDDRSSWRSYNNSSYNENEYIFGTSVLFLKVNLAWPTKNSRRIIKWFLNEFIFHSRF